MRSATLGSTLPRRPHLHRVDAYMLAENTLPRKLRARRPPSRVRSWCRLRTSSGSRHCSLRVLQLVVGEHAASPHAPSAGRGHCAAAIRSALDTVNRPDGGFRDPMESCATGLAALEESSKHSAVRLFQPSAAARASGAGRGHSKPSPSISVHRSTFCDNFPRIYSHKFKLKLIQ